MTSKKDPLGGEGWDGIDNNIEDDPVALTPKSAKGKPAAKAAPAEAERRTRIVLEDNDMIPPNGQFFGADGKGFMIRPGEEVDVPDSILGILDTAIMSVPVTDGASTVVGYRDRLRFPYRVVTSRRAA
jgi:hypothetical protein